MAGMGAVFQKIGHNVAARPSMQQTAAKPGAQATKPSVLSAEKKPFDINIYFKAVGIFFSDFFGKKLPYFFKNMGPVLSGTGAWWNKLPQDEQLSYVGLLFGHILLIVGVVLFFVL